MSTNQSGQQNACCAVIFSQLQPSTKKSCAKLSSKCPGVDLDLDKFNLSDVDHMGSWAACSGGAESLEAHVQLGKVSR